MSKTNTSKILKSIKEGDTKNYLQDLYDLEYPKIKSYILSNSGSEDDARDIFQEGLMTLISHVKLGKYKEEYEIGGFLFSVSRNAWRKKAVKVKEQEELTEGLGYSYSPYADMFSDERKKLIGDLLDEVGENCKKILVSILFHGMSLKEVAEKLGYTNTDAVKTRNYKCKKRLGKLMTQNPETETYLRNSLYD